MKRLAVIGFPVAHSRSPAIQNAALAALGLAGEWSYEAIEVLPEAFERRVRALPEDGFIGVNVTVPHKRAALALADSASDVANAIGAANTLSFLADGIRADNTDAEGLLAALPGSPAGRRALVLGAGGAARAAVWALLNGGAEVSIWNRTPARAQQLATELGAVALDSESCELQAASFDVIVNATSAGMLDSGSQIAQLPLSPEAFDEGQVVVDLAYGKAETELTAAARRRAAEVIDGREVLIRQGAASLRIWTGAEPPLEAMRLAARA